jgi:hypothetical protein
MSDKKALLIGITYKNDENNRLFGCINDTYLMRSILFDKFNVSMNNFTLMNDDFPNWSLFFPTYDNIIRQLNNFINEINKNNTSCAYIFYSGHGYQLRDKNGDELDGYDEQIVPVDFQNKGFISDDLIFSIISKLNKKTKLYFILDACHSGTITDLPFIYSNKNFIYNKNFKKSKKYRTVKNLINDLNLKSCNIVSIASSRDSQYSIDGFNTEKNQYNGVFIMAFYKLINEFGTKLSIKNFENNIKKFIHSSYKQITTLSSSKQLNVNNILLE